jgi:creatinine amidohydrolase/Fe(II)-dependent formamide hydrolase-like protein
MERRYEYLYRQELQELIARKPIAWVALGILERHGDHAGKSETSLHLALGGEVHLERIRPEHADQIGSFSTRRPLPTEALRKYGQELLETILGQFRRQLVTNQ